MNELASCPSLKDRPPYGQASLWDMLRFHADRFLSVLNVLAALEHFRDANAMFGDSRRKYIGGLTTQLCEQLEELRMPVSLKKVRDLDFIFNHAIFGADEIEATGNLVKKGIEELRSRMETEFESKMMFCMSESYVEYWPDTTAKLNSDDEILSDKFAASAYDLEAAGKCLALEQGTACVLHLMRALESAVQRLATCLAIGKVEKEWGKLLSDIHHKIEAMPKGEVRDSWSEVHANLYHVKQAWRNRTMHPLEKYTPSEAAEVFDATKTFMRHLAVLV